MDQDDPLAEFRTRFTFPTMKSLPCSNFNLLNWVWYDALTQTGLFLPTADESLVKDDEECIYLCGNSLGLKPKTADLYMKDVLDCWGNMWVDRFLLKIRSKLMKCVAGEYSLTSTAAFLLRIVICWSKIHWLNLLELHRKKWCAWTGYPSTSTCCWFRSTSQQKRDTRLWSRTMRFPRIEYKILNQFPLIVLLKLNDNISLVFSMQLFHN